MQVLADFVDDLYNFGQAGRFVSGQQGSLPLLVQLAGYVVCAGELRDFGSRFASHGDATIAQHLNESLGREQLGIVDTEVLLPSSGIRTNSSPKNHFIR